MRICYIIFFLVSYIIDVNTCFLFIFGYNGFHVSNLNESIHVIIQFQVLSHLHFIF